MSGEWQPIDTAPQDATIVLLWDGIAVMAGYYRGVSYDDPTGWVVLLNEVGHDWPTHWMPLPEPPQ